MSQPAPTPDRVDTALQWTGLVVWVALLLACALSSIYLVMSLVQGSVLGGFYPLTPEFLDQGEQRMVAATGFVFSLVAAGALLGAWLTLGKAAHHLIDEAVNGGEVEGAGAPAGWLRDKEDGGLPMSLPGTVVSLLGVTWAILLLMSPLLALMRVMLQD